MSERTYGSVKEWDFKEYGPEDAGQKVGWTTIAPNPDTDSFYVVGAYATVGEEGGSISVLEDTATSERLWHTGLTKGLSRACAYAILVIPGKDTRIQNTDVVRFSRDSAQDLAGHTHHNGFNIDDDTVLWGKGEDELTANLQRSMEEFNAGEEYPRIYLTINGKVAHGMHIRGFPDIAASIAENQIYDPSLSQTAKEEMERFNAYAQLLGEQTENDIDMLRRAEIWSLSGDEFTSSRENARAAYLRVEELRRTMISPTVAYTPEGYVRSWPYMDASESSSRVAYGMELDAIEEGNFAKATYELEREIKELHSRQQYAARGALAMFALTVDHRQ